jgi:hypothetical protein
MSNQSSQVASRKTKILFLAFGIVGIALAVVCNL